LREPSRKVKEDVEKEWRGKVEKLEEQLESKHIWACRLDENVRAVTAENKILKAVSRQIQTSLSGADVL
jgi:centromeric protein E